MKNVAKGMLFSLILLAGCDDVGLYDKAIQKLSADYSTEISLAKEYLAEVQQHNFAPIEEKIDPSLKSNQLHNILEEMAANFPTTQPENIKLVGLYHNDFSSNIAAKSSTTDITFEYQFPEKWVQANVMFKNKDNNYTIVGIHVMPLADSLENINKFTLSGKSPISYIILVATCLMPIFIIISLIVCIKTPVPKRKWLWILFILFGFMSVQLNWTDGSINISPLRWQILGAGFMKGSPYGPLILSVSLPLGAIAFLIRRKKWTAVNNTNGT